MDDSLSKLSRNCRPAVKVTHTQDLLRFEELFARERTTLTCPEGETSIHTEFLDAILEENMEDPTTMNYANEEYVTEFPEQIEGVIDAPDAERPEDHRPRGEHGRDRDRASATRDDDVDDDFERIHHYVPVPSRRELKVSISPVRVPIAPVVKEKAYVKPEPSGKKVDIRLEYKEGEPDAPLKTEPLYDEPGSPSPLTSPSPPSSRSLQHFDERFARRDDTRAVRDVYHHAPAPHAPRVEEKADWVSQRTASSSPIREYERAAAPPLSRGSPPAMVYGREAHRGFDAPARDTRHFGGRLPQTGVGYTRAPIEDRRVRGDDGHRDDRDFRHSFPRKAEIRCGARRCSPVADRRARSGSPPQPQELIRRQSRPMKRERPRAVDDYGSRRGGGGGRMTRREDAEVHFDNGRCPTVDERRFGERGAGHGFHRERQSEAARRFHRESERLREDAEEIKHIKEQALKVVVACEKFEKRRAPSAWKEDLYVTKPDTFEVSVARAGDYDGYHRRVSTPAPPSRTTVSELGWKSMQMHGGDDARGAVRRGSDAEHYYQGEVGAREQRDVERSRAPRRVGTMHLPQQRQRTPPKRKRVDRRGDELVRDGTGRMVPKGPSTPDTDDETVLDWDVDGGRVEGDMRGGAPREVNSWATSPPSSHRARGGGVGGSRLAAREAYGPHDGRRYVR